MHTKHFSYHILTLYTQTQKHSVIQQPHLAYTQNTTLTPHLYLVYTHTHTSYHASTKYTENTSLILYSQPCTHMHTHIYNPLFCSPRYHYHTFLPPIPIQNTSDTLHHSTSIIPYSPHMHTHTQSHLPQFLSHAHVCAE